jgi:hypothetical protein
MVVIEIDNTVHTVTSQIRENIYDSRQWLSL